jgi:uncharacterized protein
MPRRQLRAFTNRLRPKVDALTHHPTVRRFAPALSDPDLWHLNRRSTALAVAVGLFCGLVPGPFQVISAIGLAILVRANFPLAIITTFYTNPFTIVPLYVIAYEFGRVFVPGSAEIVPFAAPPGSGPVEYLTAVLHWGMAMGKPLALGLVLLAVTLSAAGWAAVRIGWRIHAAIAWRRRALQRRRKPE